jgi:hypothetical protein
MSRAGSSLALAALAAALLLNGARLNHALRPQREAFVSGDVEDFRQMPPAVALATVALGSIRGLIADALWLRIARVQEQGRYFELVQLADWITALEPRFTPAWSFHAWNLAYNVSAHFSDPKDRWRWVQHGIRMLRDRGLVLNSTDAQLYWELGWLFQHKIGLDLDAAHITYKSAWAREMATLFDGPAPDYDALASLPRTRVELLRDPQVAAAAEALQSRGIDPFNLDALLAAENTRAGGPAGGRSTLILWLQRERMMDVYKLLPDVMRSVDDADGPLDWRLPEAHALYWAARGLPHADGIVALQLERMRFQSLAAAFRHGRVFRTPDGLLTPSPNLDLMPRVRQVYVEAVEAFPGESTVRSAYRNWLNEAIDILVVFHRMDAAQELFEELRQRYPEAVTEEGFETYVALRRLEQFDSVNNSRTASALIEGLCLQGLLWYAMGDEDRYAGYVAHARLAWNHCRNRFPDQAHGDRLRIPPYRELRQRAYQRALDQVTSKEARARLMLLQDGHEGQRAVRNGLPFHEF